MTKRVALARALALDPDIVFLDEPTSGLDPIGAGDFDTLIATLQRTLGLTVFMVTHDLDSLHTVCDRIAVLADGKVIAAGTMETMLASTHPWLQRLFPRQAVAGGRSGESLAPKRCSGGVSSFGRRANASAARSTSRSTTSRLGGRHDLAAVDEPVGDHRQHPDRDDVRGDIVERKQDIERHRRQHDAHAQVHRACSPNRWPAG